MKYLTAFLASMLIASAALADCNKDAEAALRDGRVSDSIRILTDCLEQDLGSIARTWFLLGEARREQGRRNSAIDSFTKAIELSDDRDLRAMATLRRGEVRLSKRDREGAEADFTEAIAADPTLAAAYYGRARILHKRDDLDGALADYTRAIELDDRNARAFFYRASIYRKRELDSLAVADYDRAIELAPNFVRAHAERAFTFMFPIVPVLIVLMLG